MELKYVRAQLADSVKENKRLLRGIYGKISSELCDSSARKFFEKNLLAGMLMGRPEEEMPSSAGDLLQELSQMHNRARQVCTALLRPCGHQAICRMAWGSLWICFKEHGGASDCGRCQPAGKVQEKPGLW